MDELAQSFVGLGLPSKQAAEIARSAKASQALSSLIAGLPPEDGAKSPRFDPKTASLLAQWATAAAQLDPERRAYGSRAIIDGKLASAAQLDGKRRRRLW